MKKEKIISHGGQKILLNSNSSTTKSPKVYFIIPVGEQEKPLNYGFRYVTEVNKVILLCSKETENIALKIKARFEETYNVEIVLIDPSSFENITKTVYPRIKDGDLLIINLTGGTKVMVLAMYFLAQIKDSKCFYLFKTKDGSMEKHIVPVISLPEEISKIRRKIIGEDTRKNKIKKKAQIIELIRECPMKLTNIAKELKITKATLEGHLKYLNSLHMIIREKKGKEVYLKLSPTGEILYHIIKNYYPKREG